METRRWNENETNESPIQSTGREIKQEFFSVGSFVRSSDRSPHNKSRPSVRMNVRKRSSLDEIPRRFRYGESHNHDVLENQPMAELLRRGGRPTIRPVLFFVPVLFRETTNHELRSRNDGCTQDPPPPPRTGMSLRFVRMARVPDRSLEFWKLCGDRFQIQV